MTDISYHKDTSVPGSPDMQQISSSLPLQMQPFSPTLSNSAILCGRIVQSHIHSSVSRTPEELLVQTNASHQQSLLDTTAHLPVFKAVLGFIVAKLL